MIDRVQESLKTALAYSYNKGRLSDADYTEAREWLKGFDEQAATDAWIQFMQETYKKAGVVVSEQEIRNTCR